MKKNFEIVQLSDGDGYAHRTFWIPNEYSHFSDYEVYKNSKKLKYAKSLKKLQNKWRVLNTKEAETLIDRFHSSEFSGYFMVHKGGAIVKDAKEGGTEIILGGHEHELEEEFMIRIVRKIKKK